jgi:hypothetical protein
MNLDSLPRDLPGSVPTPDGSSNRVVKAVILTRLEQIDAGHRRSDAIPERTTPPADYTARKPVGESRISLGINKADWSCLEDRLIELQNAMGAAEFKLGTKDLNQNLALLNDRAVEVLQILATIDQVPDDLQLRRLAIAGDALQRFVPVNYFNCVTQVSKLANDFSAEIRRLEGLVKSAGAMAPKLEKGIISGSAAGPTEANRTFSLVTSFRNLWQRIWEVLTPGSSRIRQAELRGKFVQDISNILNGVGEKALKEKKNEQVEDLLSQVQQAVPGKRRVTSDILIEAIALRACQGGAVDQRFLYQVARLWPEASAQFKQSFEEQGVQQFLQRSLAPNWKELPMEEAILRLSEDVQKLRSLREIAFKKNIFDETEDDENFKTHVAQQIVEEAQNANVDLLQILGSDAREIIDLLAFEASPVNLHSIGETRKSAFRELSQAFAANDIAAFERTCQNLSERIDRQIKVQASDQSKLNGYPDAYHEFRERLLSRWLAASFPAASYSERLHFWLDRLEQSPDPRSAYSWANVISRNLLVAAMRANEKAHVLEIEDTGVYLESFSLRKVRSMFSVLPASKVAANLADLNTRAAGHSRLKSGKDILLSIDVAKTFLEDWAEGTLGITWRWQDGRTKYTTDFKSAVQAKVAEGLSEEEAEKIVSDEMSQLLTEFFSDDTVQGSKLLSQTATLQPWASVQAILSDQKTVPLIFNEAPSFSRSIVSATKLPDGVEIEAGARIVVIGILKNRNIVDMKRARINVSASQTIKLESAGQVVAADHGLWSVSLEPENSSSSLAGPISVTDRLPHE